MIGRSLIGPTVSANDSLYIADPSDADTVILAVPCQFNSGVKVNVDPETVAVIALVSDTAERVVASPSSSVTVKVTVPVSSSLIVTSDIAEINGLELNKEGSTNLLL